MEDKLGNTMRWPLYIGLFLAAYFVLNVTNDIKTKCYEIITTEKEPNTILLNKCKGSTWMMVHTPLTGDDGKEGKSFTYRWYSLSRDYAEAELIRQ